MRKIFLLWDRHTTGFIRVLFALSILSAFSPTFALLYVQALLILSMITTTGYTKKWDKLTEVKDDE
jgi:hypothetical protein